MRKALFLGLLVAVLLVAAVDGQCSSSGKWKLVPSVTVPPLKLVESAREDKKLDVVFSAGVGAGIAYAKVETDSLTGKETRKVSISPFTILISGDTTAEEPDVDLSYCVTFGFFDDLIMIGAGYNFGSNLLEDSAGNVREVSRWFLLLGLGVTFR